ncbi:hypothetical protein, partial [Muribaculum sp.]|uniref:hypothetical protein n=1 Tax=Muribaculum sp. TaxID=1918611 RepID=UPI0023C79467
LRHMSKIVSSYTTLAATFIIKQALNPARLSPLLHLLHGRLPNAISARLSAKRPENECELQR